MDGHEGFHSVFKLTYICLLCIGAWPQQSESFIVRVLSKILCFSSILIMIIFANMMQTAQLILYWGDLNMLITILSTADLPIANSMMMLVLFSYKRKGLQDITLMAKNDWIKLKTNKELEIMNESAKTVKMLSKFCIILGQCSCLSYLISHIYLQCTIYSGVRLSYLVSYIPYDHEKSPNYEITLIFQCLSSFIATAAFIGIESFFIIIVMHVCAKLNILSNRIQSLSLEDLDLKKNKNYVHIKKEISFIVEQHNDLFRISSEIEDIFTTINFMQLVNFTLIFCLLGFRVVTMLFEKTGTYLEIIFVIGFFTYLSSNLFVCCYAAEQLRLKSMDVGHATYKCSWYQMETSEIKSLMLILYRSQKPFQISAGKFFIFSLNTFTSLMKTSASYLSVLIAIKEK